MASENLVVGTSSNSNNGDTLRAAFIKVKKMFAEIYNQTYSEQGDLSGTTFKVDHSQLSNRFVAEVAVSTLTGTVDYDFSSGSIFKLSGDLTGAYTINLTNYKKGQIITVFPLKGQTISLTGGSGTGVFNKIGGVDYDNTTSSILQIECVDDQATDPIFFYSIATFASDSSI